MFVRLFRVGEGLGNGGRAGLAGVGWGFLGGFAGLKSTGIHLHIALLIFTNQSNLLRNKAQIPKPPSKAQSPESHSQPQSLPLFFPKAQSLSPKPKAFLSKLIDRLSN